MKVYLDDEREAPEGWTKTHTVKETIELLKTGEVKVISLDHDLGDDKKGVGYDVLVWIEEEIVNRRFGPPPIIKIHTSNLGAQGRMLMAAHRIGKLWITRNFCKICDHRVDGEEEKDFVYLSGQAACLHHKGVKEEYERQF